MGLLSSFLASFCCRGLAHRLTTPAPILTRPLECNMIMPAVLADGCASDPVKLAKMRAMQRAFSACHAAGRCGAVDEPHIQEFLHYTLKLFEHTW